MSSYISYFNSKKIDKSRVGGKGFVLSKLHNAKFSVPYGFNITTDAYCSLLSNNKIDKLISEKLKTFSNNGYSVAQLSKEIQEKILSADIPHNISENILEATRHLQKNNVEEVAVRSSSLSEDSAEASFAGLHDTFLGVRDINSLLESIKKCYASLWSERAIAYRIHNNLLSEDPTMAVVVQQMIPAEKSGVLFTVNPVDGKDEIVINATLGLGEALVSGHVDADAITISKKTGKISEYTKPSDTSCLNESQIKELAKIANELEILENRPQDIEWCIHQNNIYILQARPITTLNDIGEEEHWTADNAQEAVQGVVSPLSASITVSWLNELFFKFYRNLGAKEKFVVASIIDGYFYLNVSSFKKYLDAAFPMMDKEHVTVEQVFGHTTSTKITYDLRLKNLKLKPLIIFTYNMLKLPLIADKAIRQFNKELAEYNDDDIKNYTTEQSIEATNRFREMMDNTDLATCWMYASGGSVTFYLKLNDLVKAMPKELALSPMDFIRDSNAMDDAKLKKDIMTLVEEAKKNKDIFTSICTLPPENALKKFEELSESSFVKSFNSFLEQYGHLGKGLGEAMEPKWREDPTIVLQIIKSHLNSNHGSAPDETISAQEAMKKANKYFKSRSKLPFKRAQFKSTVKNARKFCALRENTRFNLIKITYKMRLMSLRQGELLKENGCLQDVNDIFFLKHEEIEKALQDEISKEKISAIIKFRKSDHEKWKKTKPPRNIYIQGNNVRKEYDQIDENAKTLKGHPASGGVVQGKARVLTDIKQANKLQKGDILVARITDPAWTSLFSLARGIVVDVGSTLSHGAIIARELGIPAVMGVRFGTEVIKDGQEITVDGTSGVVQLNSVANITSK